MKKKILLVLILAFSFHFAFGQSNFRVGVKAGMNSSTIGSWAYLYGFTVARISYHLGTFVELPISKKFSLQPEIQYSSQGNKKDFFDEAHGHLKLNYLNISLLTKSYLLKRFSGEVGPYAGFLIKAKDRDNMDVTKDFKNLDVGAVFAGTYRLPSGLFTGVSYRIGLKNINEFSATKGKNQNSVGQLFVGYSF